MRAGAIWAAARRRAAEPSTWAGVAAGAAAVGEAMRYSGTARYVAIGLAGITALVAMLRAEGDTDLAERIEALEAAVQPMLQVRPPG